MVLERILSNLNNLSSPRVHLVGIKGVGMTGLAQLLKTRGFRVSGSDTHEKFFTDTILKHLKIQVIEHFSAKNIRGADFIISSNAYLGQKLLNPEIAVARKKRIPIFSYPDAVAQLFNNSYGIAVAGSHGKSTLSAMLAVTLEKLGADPTALIGAEVLNWKTTARTGKKPPYYFVLEADEYKKAFLKYKPKIIVITSADWDHPDVFPSPKSYRAAFISFIKQLAPGGIIVFWGDDPEVQKIVSYAAKKTEKISYGNSSSHTVRVTRVNVSPRGTTFSVTYKEKSLGQFHTALIGRRNASNATAVITVCLSLGFTTNAIRKALATFRGTRRRFEVLSHKKGPLIIDDYGHHPAEIKATIHAAREAFPKRRILVLFQPHTFSRTQALFPDFVAALTTADKAYILTTYGSAREQKGAVGSQDLAKALGSPYFETQQSAIRYLSRELRPRDVLLAMGAGDQWQIAKKLAAQKFERREKS